MADPLLTIAGRYKSDKKGATAQLPVSGVWTELKTSEFTHWYLRNYEQANSVTVLMYINATGINVTGVPQRGKLFRSIDRGLTWTDVTPSSGNEEFVSGTAQSADLDLWCITDERDSFAQSVGGPSRIYKSTDDGATWVLSHEITEASFTTRKWPAYNIAAHPTDGDIICVEGAEMVLNNPRMWRTTDGGDNWSTITPTFDDTAGNVGGLLSHAYDFEPNGDMVYGYRNSANSKFLIYRSIDDGSDWTTHFSFGAGTPGPARQFIAQNGKLYIVAETRVFEVESDFGSDPTVIANKDDSPFSSADEFGGITNYNVNGVDTLFLGSFSTDSVYTRPADLSSDWVIHPDSALMNTELGDDLSVAMQGIVGATKQVEDIEPVRPPPPDEPPGGGGPMGEPGTGDPGVGEPRLPKREPVKRRGLRGRRGFKAGPPGTRGKLPPVQGERIDKSVPDEFELPLVRKWLDFGWLVRPMLEGQKTITLRDWGTIEGVQWQHGELFYAYDGAPVEGGRRLALCRVMQVPFEDFTAGLTMADYHKLGFSWAMAFGLTAPSGRTALEVWEDLHTNPQKLWLLRFQVERIFEQGRKEQSTVQIAERPSDVPGLAGV